MSELSDRILLLNRNNTALSYKAVLEALVRQEGITVNHALVQNLDASLHVANTGEVIPIWPAVLYNYSLSLLQYKTVPLEAMFEHLHRFKLIFPVATVVSHQSMAKLLRNLRPNLYRGANIDRNFPTYYQIDYSEKPLVKANTPPTIDNFADNIRFRCWERHAYLSVVWNLEDPIDEFMAKLDKQHKAYLRAIAKKRTTKDVYAALYPKYMAEIWNPRQAWYNALTPENQKKV